MAQVLLTMLGVLSLAVGALAALSIRSDIQLILVGVCIGFSATFFGLAAQASKMDLLKRKIDNMHRALTKLSE